MIWLSIHLSAEATNDSRTRGPYVISRNQAGERANKMGLGPILGEQQPLLGGSNVTITLC